MTAYLFATALGWWTAAATADETVTVRPLPTEELFANPGMGWQTFHRFSDDDPNLDGLPSASAYFRFYWRDLEPEEGRIAFDRLDGLLARARQAGQKLAFRVMCAGTSDDYMYVPQWLKDQGCPGFEYQYQSRGPKHWAPDMDDGRFLRAHLRLIDVLGRRYDGHPDLDLVDIGSVGLWGEWHMSGTGVPVPSEETRLRLIDAYLDAFPRTPKVMLIGDAEGMEHALGRGAGWRADCLGDMGGFSRTWNHMEHFYRQQIRRTRAEDAWRVGPVAFESCWDMRRWQQEGWDTRFIFDYALDLHASYVNNKSAPLPSGAREDVERLLRRLGYRLVLREARHRRQVAPGGDVPVVTVWENAGVAPPYRDDRIAFRLRSAAGGEHRVIATDTSIRGWLPGEREVEAAVRVPPDVPLGSYDLEIAVVDAVTREPAVRLAIEGRGEDGWYRLGAVQVAAP
jgi:hypothetical protein